MKKRLFSIMLSVTLVVSLLTVFAPQARAVTYGPYNSGNITWTVDVPAGEQTGTLYIERRSGVTGNVSITGSPWSAHSAQVHTVEIGQNISVIGDSAFTNFGNLTRVIVRGTVTSIGSNAFRGCVSLVEFLNDLGGAFNGLTTIGSSAFYNCYSLRSLYIPAVTSIGAEAFVGCRSLSSINAGTTGRVRMYDGVIVEMNAAGTVPIRVIKSPVDLGASPRNVEYRIPAGVTTIDSEAFAYCDYIARFIIPASVTTVGNRAFAYSSNLLSATFEGDAPTSFGSNVFSGINDASFRIIYYPHTQRWTTPRWQGYLTQVNNSRLELDRYVVVMEIGTTAQLRATQYPSTASQNVIWASADQMIATVTGSDSTSGSIGIITAVDVGTTTITVQAESDSTAVAHCTVIVVDSGISSTLVLLDQSRIQARLPSINDDPASFPPTLLTAVVYPFPDADDPDRLLKIADLAENLVWTSSNPSVAAVRSEPHVSSPFTRVILLRSVGTTTITVRTPDGRSSASCVVTVEAATTFIPVTNVTLATSTVAMGTTINLSDISTVYPENATNRTTTWQIVANQSSITGATIAGGALTVPWGQTGNITVQVTVPRGRADTTWGYGQADLPYTRTFNLNVVQFIPVAEITDVPTLAFAGVPLQLRGTVLPAGASDRNIIWARGNVNTTGEAVLFDPATGILTAQAPGTISVTATIENARLADSGAIAGEYTRERFTWTFIIRVDPHLTNALTLRADPGGSVSGAGAGQFAGGEIITITATPNAGYIFTGWYTSNGGTFADASRATTQFTMPGNVTTVTAYFTYVGLPGGSTGSWGGGVVLPTPVHYFTNNSIYTRNSSVTFGHVTMRDFQMFSYATLDGRTLSRNAHYTANRAGSYTEIILANGYLNALEPGAHTLTVYFSDYVSVTAIFTVVLAAQVSPNYDDVYSSDWYAVSVAYVSDRGWMAARPTEPRRFRPSDTVAQVEVIVALYRMAGSPAILNQYGQALQGQEAAYEWVRSNGILPLGGTYTLYSAITRQDIAVILGRMVSVMRLNYPVVRSAPSFADEWQIDPNARSAVNAIYRAGIMGGRTANTFVPLGNVTRAECASLLHRFAEALGRW